MTRQQTTSHIEGARSLLGRVMWLVGGNLQVEARRSSSGYSILSRLLQFPLIQINYIGRFPPSPAANVWAAVLVVSSFGSRPILFKLLEQALQFLIQRFPVIHGAFSNALRFLRPVPQSLNTMRDPKFWKKNTKFRRGAK